MGNLGPTRRFATRGAKVPHYVRGHNAVERVEPKIWTRAMSMAENGEPCPHSSLRDSWCQGSPLRAGHIAVEKDSNLKYGLVQLV